MQRNDPSSAEENSSVVTAVVFVKRCKANILFIYFLLFSVAILTIYTFNNKQAAQSLSHMVTHARTKRASFFPCKSVEKRKQLLTRYDKKDKASTWARYVFRIQRTKTRAGDNKRMNVEKQAHIFMRRELIN